MKRESEKVNKAPELPVYSLNLIRLAIRIAGKQQTGSPDELQLAWAMPGSKDLEARFHKTLEAQRVRGEWFDLGPELLALRRLDDLARWACFTLRFGCPVHP